MGNTAIKRDHKGELHLFVGDVPALGARVQKFEYLGADVGMCAVVYVPMAHTKLGEFENILPFPPGARSG